MRRIVISVLLVACLVPSPVYAWGWAAHRYIMHRAIDLLPSEIGPVFIAFRDELALRVVDPDLWQLAGWDDGPNHFLDLGVSEFGAYPFKELPREYTAALDKFGMTVLRRNGLLPWREAEEFGNLRRAFEDFKRDADLAPARTVLFAAVASHYIQDAYQPLHATDNYDGQLTGQSGVHARFETALFERFQSRLTVTPRPVRPISAPRDASFDALLSGYLLVKPLLDADKEAIGTRDAYDDAYFEAFFSKVKPMLEQRLAEAITATASIIAGAWEAAGRPALKTGMPQPVQKVRPPRR